MIIQNKTKTTHQTHNATQYTKQDNDQTQSIKQNNTKHISDLQVTTLYQTTTDTGINNQDLNMFVKQTNCHQNTITNTTLNIFIFEIVHNIEASKHTSNLYT